MEKYIFDCTECSKFYSTLGGLHSHIERKHRSAWSIPGDKDELMKFTRVLKITETEEVDIEDVDAPTRNGFVDYFTGIIGLKS